MNSSLYTGVLGLKNHQTRMDVIGNNIANVNTYGFKQGRATFADLLSRTYQSASAPRGGRGGTNPLQVGLGVSTVSVTNIMNQGQIETTGRLTDVAVDGNGWFVLKDGSGDTVYTRDGAFALDKEGSLVNANGRYVQGWSRIKVTDDHDFTVDTTRPVGNIDFQVGEKLEAAATNKVGLKCNLDEGSRSLIADGVDPREGFATKNDLLVDLYDNDQVNPEHLGIREGDWLEIHVDTQYIQQPDLTSATSSTLNITGGGTDVYASDAAKTGTLWRYTSLISESNLPLMDPQNGGAYDLTFGGNLAALTRVFDSPDDLAARGAGFFTIDPDTGMIYVSGNVGDADPLATASVTYFTQLSAESTSVYEGDKYLYYQVSNDTDIGDLETVIQNALDAIDVNGTMDATVKYNTDEAKFYIYNNDVTGSRDYNDIHVEINAVSGSGIRQGYLLRESTYPTLTGTRLGLINGGLGGAMTREHIANFDYQTTSANLDYGNVNGSAQLYAQVIRSRLDQTWSAGLGGLNADGYQYVDLTDWKGYTDGGDLKMIEDTGELSVDGTVWREVEVFTGAANEYLISLGNDASGNLGVPRVYFNTVGGNSPSANAAMVFSYRTDTADNNLLVEGVDYTIDATTGQISLKWDSTSADAVFGASTGAANPGNAGFTGTVRLTADYTTEDRLLEPPATIMNSRWADFAQEYAEVSAGGAGKARTAFNTMFSSINADRSASTPGTINDQATSTEPTAKTSTRFQAGDVYRTSIDVYDSLGDTHTLQFVFTHVGSNYDLTEQIRYQNRWYWRAELPFSDVFSFDSMDIVDSDVSSAKLNGQIEFDENGLIVTSKLAGNIGPIMFDPSPIGANGNSTEATENVSIDLDVDGHGVPIDGVTQYASDFTTRAYEQNGWEMGILETFAVDQNGIIEGRYSNNVVKPIAQLGLAMFPNEEGLHKEGSNVFSLSANTGLPNIVPAFVGGAGSIVGGSLEQSNVDIISEFTNMIITERGFQANSRIITTSDEMLTEVINLKR